MNCKDRKNTIQKHLEISKETNKILEDITKSINDELDGKYYQWQIVEVAICLLQSQLKAMDTDRKQELLDKTEGKKNVN